MPELALYDPNALQRRLHESTDRHRFGVYVCPRQHGKSTFVRVEAIHRAMQGQHVAIIGPLRYQIKNIHWIPLKQTVEQIPGVDRNETELRVVFPGGGFVQLFGSDNADALRGLSLDAAFFDEAAYISEDVWPLIVRPALSARRGSAYFVSTPHGRSWFHQVYQQAEQAPGWDRLHIRVTELDVLPPEEVASARAAMSEEEFNQEFLCAWDAVQVGSIYAKELAAAEAEGRVGEYPWDPAGAMVAVALDIGMHDSTALVAVQAVQQGLHVIDYEEHAGLGLPDWVRLLKAKPYFPCGQYIAPFDIGNQEWGSGKSRVEVAAEMGIHFDIAPRLTVAEGLDAVKRTFPRFSFHRRPCERLLEALAGYHRVWRPDLKAFSEKPEHSWHSHGCDAVRYFCLGFEEPLDDMANYTPQRAQIYFNPLTYRGEPPLIGR